MNAAVDFETCQWPDINEPYLSALQQAVAFGLSQCAPVGIIAAGSILRGEAGPTSDWDLHLIHLEPRRRRLQRRFYGVPAELFVNSPPALRSYFESEHRSLRPSTAHMLTTGFVVLNRSPVIDELLAEARTWLATPPEVDENDLVARRYAAVDILDNARDLRITDPAGARLLLNRAMLEMITYVFWAEPRWLPRPKLLLAALAEVAPKTANLVHDYLRADSLDEAVDLAERIALQTIGETAFFEWSSAWEPFPTHVQSVDGSTDADASS